MDLHPLLLLFLQVALVIAVSRLGGLLFARLRQPQVLGEIVAAVLLGPSLLGWVWPAGFTALFPAHSHAYVDILAQVGVVFFLFLVGLELDPRLVRARGRGGLSTGLASMLVPIALGVAFVLIFYKPLYELHSRSYRGAALFMGLAMAAASFPMMARILTERNLQRTDVGALAIACAAVNDLSSWCLLAVVVAITGMQGLAHAALMAGLAILFISAMFLAVRPFLGRLEVIYDRRGRLSQNVMAVIFLLILASAYTAEAIGGHALFGAFLLGWVMPKGTQFVRHLSEKLEDYTVVFLLPVFFLYTGLHTDMHLIRAGGLWGFLGLIVVLAIAGKWGGATLAARGAGMPWRESVAVGALLNTRGLMALIVLSVGRETGLMPPAVYAMMVVMTLVTTAMTTPVLHYVYPRRLATPLESSSPAPAPTATGDDGHRAPGLSILIPVALPKSGGPLVQLADTLIGPDKAHSKLVAIHLRKPVDHEAYRSGLDEAAVTHEEALAPLLAQARGRSLRVEQASFVSRDVGGDIARFAADASADLVIMGFHKPVIGKTILGGTVHRVLAGCHTDVAIFVDRGFRAARRILVPYLGTAHDKLALDLAARMARSTEALVTVLHVVPPMRGGSTQSADGARHAVDRVFHAPGHDLPVTFRVVEDESPVGVVVHQAQNADLVIIGVAEEWGLESHLFGWRAQRIARDCPSSMLIVRKYEPKPAPTPEPATTAG
ncbi:MAG: cation:proton antiporter [Phycisphaerae bacterium]